MLDGRCPAKFALLIALALCGGVGAQEQQKPASPEPRAPAPASTIRVKVQQVLVPVVVTDKHGHNVTGLAARDFQVLEDGVPQQIVNFSTEYIASQQELATIPPGPTATAPGPGPAVSPGPAPLRTYLICIDTQNSAFENFSGVRAALHKLFKQENGSDSHSQYALIALGRQPLVIQDLTPDPAAMLPALDKKELSKSIQQSESSNLAMQEYQFTAMLGDYCQKCPCAGMQAATTRTSGGTDQVCSGKLQQLEIWAGSAAQERSAMTRDFLHNLRALVEHLAKSPGKRILIFVSDGFNRRPGRDLFGMIAAYIGNPSEVLKSTGDDVEPELQEILRLATARDVTFYTLDSRGLYAPSGGGYDAGGDYQMTRITVILPQIQQQKETTALENQDAMAELAATTGGVFSHNSNDLLKGMHQAFEDGREYYVLAYALTNQTADGKFHRIQVDVKGKGLVVRAKRGYWAPSN
jgi:VWFA-related protein